MGLLFLLRYLFENSSTHTISVGLAVPSVSKNPTHTISLAVILGLSLCPCRRVERLRIRHEVQIEFRSISCSNSVPATASMKIDLIIKFHPALDVNFAASALLLLTACTRLRG